MRFSTLALVCLSALASATQPPTYPGYNLVWSDAFEGDAGQTPNTKKWKIITNLNTNNDLQTYTTSSKNLQLSGGSTVQLVPVRHPKTHAWTSARIESHAAFTPAPNKTTLISASIRFGSNPQDTKQGMWPAFWLLGESIRHGTPWPRCGEVDIMETVNGLPEGFGTVHCGEGDDKMVGGPCNEPIGRGGRVAVEDYDWHVWSVEVDRTGGNGWRGEVIRWKRDGVVFWELTGEMVGVEGVWGTLAHSPMFVILNVAVGGDWPGAPNSATADSYGSMMEIEYVAVYST